MTFQEFQASKVWSDDLATHLPDYFDAAPDDPNRGKGWVYHGDLVIESAVTEGQWCLIIHDQEWASFDLASLERRLFDYAVDEQICA